MAVPPVGDEDSGEAVHQQKPNHDEDVIMAGVKLYGQGKWKKILQNCKFDIQRTNVQLKDKWRNMTKNM